jgi:hypothetical protein
MSDIDVSTIGEYALFKIREGHLYFHDHDGDLDIGEAWAGNNAGKNNPDMCAIRDIGPLPVGWYEIGEPFTHPHTGHFSMRLTPHEDNKMFGRDGFLMHGPDRNPEQRGEESRGCVVTRRDNRERVHTLKAVWLKVEA